MRILKVLALVVLPVVAQAQGEVHLYSGYLTRIRCNGRLLVAAVGNQNLVRVEPLPKELGCMVLLKPLLGAGKTNLLLETSTGTHSRFLVIESGVTPAKQNLEFTLSGDES